MNNIIQKDNKFYKECYPVLVPTNYSKTNIPPIKDLVNDGALSFTGVTGLTTSTYYHLYILSNEEIKENDQCINKLDTKPIKYNKELFCNGVFGYKKIIATTNPELHTKLVEEGDGKIWDISKPSEQFIQEFVKANGKIEKCLVEVEEILSYELTGMTKLKISSDNTVNIIPFEDDWDNVWNNILDTLHFADLINWLKENYHPPVKK